MSRQLCDVISDCAETTKSKGFDVTQHQTQLLLIASEVAEGLSYVTYSGHEMLDYICRNISFACREIERMRTTEEALTDMSIVMDHAALMEELADVVIRVFSYAGGNGWSVDFEKALEAKIEKNKLRPHKHGKGF